jgi:hypothetical protein
MKRLTQLPNARQRRLNIRLSQQEWDKVHKLASNTTCRSVSEYARKVLAEKPVKVFYRNKSFDEFEEKMAPFLSLMESFADNFTLLIKRISALNDIPEIKVVLSIVLDCETRFLHQVEEIKEQLEKLSDQCDPK